MPAAILRARKQLLGKWSKRPTMRIKFVWEQRAWLRVPGPRMDEKTPDSAATPGLPFPGDKLSVTLCRLQNTTALLSSRSNAVMFDNAYTHIL